MSVPNIPTRILMFRDFVPDRVRVFLCLFFAVTFQFSGGIYWASVSQMVGSLALMQEDIMMAGYASFVGTTIVFPILFRLKFRFTSRSIFLMVCPALIVCYLITMNLHRFCMCSRFLQLYTLDLVLMCHLHSCGPGGHSRYFYPILE